jgi:quercetin dioxygenase-like cupin family protein
MNKQECRDVLRVEEFPVIYEWKDEPGKIYELHHHEGKVSMFITKGSIEFDFNGEKRLIQAGERIDIAPNTEHSATVGPEGCEYIVGQISEDDA